MPTILKRLVSAQGVVLTQLEARIPNAQSTELGCRERESHPKPEPVPGSTGSAGPIGEERENSIPRPLGGTPVPPYGCYPFKRGRGDMLLTTTTLFSQRAFVPCCGWRLSRNAASDAEGQEFSTTSAKRRCETAPSVILRKGCRGTSRAAIWLSPDGPRHQ